MQPRRKQAIGNGFCIDVCKVVYGNIVDQVRLERLKLANQISILACFCVGQQRSADPIFNQPSLASHHFGQLFGGVDADRGLAGKILQQHFEAREFLAARRECGDHVGNADKAGDFALHDKFEIGAVGVNQVRETLFVPLLLLFAVIAAFEFLDVLEQVFRFAPAKGNAPAIEHKIDRANIDQSFRFVNNGQIVVNAFEQPFQRRTVAMLGSLPTGGQQTNLIEITTDIHPKPVLFLFGPSARITPANQANNALDGHIPPLDPRPLPAYTTPNIQPIGNGLVVAQLG